MNMHRNLTTIRRPLGGRAMALKSVRRLLTGHVKLSEIREAERNEILVCVDQTIDFLEACRGREEEVAKAIGKLKA